jgi:hypothetical protein
VNKCPMCRRKSQVLHTSQRVRALAQKVGWESGVCVDCYDALEAFRAIVLAEPVKESADERYFALAELWRESLAADDPYRHSTVVTRPNSEASRAFLDKWRAAQPLQRRRS